MFIIYIKFYQKVRILLWNVNFISHMKEMFTELLREKKYSTYWSISSIRRELANTPSDTPINGTSPPSTYIFSVKGINTTIVRTSYDWFVETCRDSYGKTL